MYKLIGAVFLTDADQDIGFPAFRVDPANILYTATLDKDLNIVAFFPIFTEKFKFLPCYDLGRFFSIGENFSFLFFRIAGAATLLDLASEVDVNRMLTIHQDKAFIRLQIARHFAKEDKSRAVQSISDAVKLFKLDKDSSFSFISSETSLLSLVNGVWETTAPPINEAMSVDDIFKELDAISTIEAMELLKKRSFQTTAYFPYLFLLFERKSGQDEFLFVVGAQYLRQFAMYNSNYTRMAAGVAHSILRRYKAMIASGQEDVDFEDTFDEISQMPIFREWCAENTEIFLTYLDIRSYRVPMLELVSDLYTKLTEGELSDSIRPSALRRLREYIQKLELDDLQSIAWSIFEDDIHEYSQIDEAEDAEHERYYDKAVQRYKLVAADKKRLLASVQRRLTRRFGESLG